MKPLPVQIIAVAPCPLYVALCEERAYVLFLVIL